MKETHPSKNFDELSDVINYQDYADWTGIGLNLAREKFNSKGFPLLPGVGNKKLANKYQVFLFDIKDEELKKVYAKEFAIQMIK